MKGNVNTSCNFLFLYNYIIIFIMLKFVLIKSVKIYFCTLLLGTRSDSDDEVGPPTKKKPDYSSPAGPSMMPPYNPMMNHMQAMGPPYMGPG